MEIDRQALEVLSLANSDGPFDDSTFKHLVEVAFRSAANELSEKIEVNALTKIAKDSLPAKQIYSSLINLILESARHDASEQDITTVVDERFTKERLALFLTYFNNYKLKIREQLSRHTSALPNIVDIEWRVDYGVQSSTLEQIRGNIYLITLTTQQADGSLDKVEFSADINQLQDLLANVKDACNVAKGLKL